MRLRIIILAIVCSLSAAFTQAYALGSGTSARGNIMLKNGTELDSVRFVMPNSRDRQVKVKIDGENRKLETDSIDCIILWHEKHPDNKYIFKPYRCEIFDIETGEYKGLTDPVWLCCETVEDNASYWFRVGRPDFKKGKIRFNYNALYSYQSTRYVLKKKSEHPCLIPGSNKDTKKWIRFYFKDDPNVIRKFEAGEYDISDWGYKSFDIHRIIADYKPTE